MLGSEVCRVTKRHRLMRLRILIKESCFLLPSIPEKEYSGLALTESE